MNYTKQVMAIKVFKVILEQQLIVSNYHRSFARSKRLDYYCATH
jgi:hypothetical protein